MRDGIDTEALHGFNFHADINTLSDGRVRARTTLGGKAFEAFDDDPRWAQRKLTDMLTEAVQNGDIVLNEI